MVFYYNFHRKLFPHHPSTFHRLVTSIVSCISRQYHSRFFCTICFL